MIDAKHYLIQGRVQGVSYRANTQRKARELGLTGWVRNLPDGQVEALAQGAPETLQAFETWLWQGPALAEVTQVEVSEADSEPADSDFIVRY
ncbi:acylphosphatase [Marinimicrobium sp. C6131]|uniref:acylphosphatase n=1 Tax=Marinimicrobium sp. C6131 TaxID=3022676 RepID=UPI00223E3426|nr:acylphosphatase [Marinimicrobium sp. C6131]UZJ44006.1 acylphosphatase [Marinimicrobium sp. C6131]